MRWTLLAHRWELRRWIGPVALLCPLLVGCASQTTSPAPAVPTPPPTSTIPPTSAVSFAVTVTAVPLPHVSRPRPRPRPTRVVIPRGPYIQLSPRSGPPINRTITVQGGHFPPNFTIQLDWSPAGRTSPIAQTAYTDRKGNLSALLAIPAAPPGVYEVVADINGVRWATARYAVVSRASLTVHVLPAAPGDTLHISGLHFLPHLKLALVVYPLFKGPSAAVIGRPVTDAYGRFVLVHIDPKLVPGQYLLRAWSLDALSSQLAETYFQVVV